MWAGGTALKRVGWIVPKLFGLVAGFFGIVNFVVLVLSVVYLPEQVSAHEFALTGAASAAALATAVCGWRRNRWGRWWLLTWISLTAISMVVNLSSDTLKMAWPGYVFMIGFASVGFLAFSRAESSGEE